MYIWTRGKKVAQRLSSRLRLVALGLHPLLPFTHLEGNTQPSASLPVKWVKKRICGVVEWASAWHLTHGGRSTLNGMKTVIQNGVSKEEGSYKGSFSWAHDDARYLQISEVLIHRHFAIFQITPPVENRHSSAFSLNTNMESKSQQLRSFAKNLCFYANGRYHIVILVFVQFVSCILWGLIRKHACTLQKQNGLGKILDCNISL